MQSELRVLSNEVPPSAGTPTTLVFIKGGAVQWIASNDLSNCVLVMDADNQEEDAAPSCWQEGMIPLSSVEPELWQIAKPLIEGHYGNTAEDVEALQHAARLTCKCGSSTWRVFERETTNFFADRGEIRPVEISERQIWCGSCGHEPTEGNRQAVEEAYLSVDPESPLIRAAIKVIVSWESYRLCDAVRNLAQTLEEIGHGTK